MFVTNSSAQTTQFFLNLPFGETMLEQRTGVYNNPYKFNAKELDKETGLYYYGARYYNPRASIWYGVDPLAVYNPAMETQFYGDGQHNGGVYFWGNLNPYIYTYQSPINLIDPNGKQAASKAHRGGGYRGIGIPIPMYEHQGVYLPFPVHTQEEYREGFNKLGNDLKAVTVIGFTAVAVSTSDVWIPLIDKYKQAVNWSNRILHSKKESEFAPTNNGEVNKEIVEVAAGRGTTRKNPDGSDKIFEGREYRNGEEGYGSQKGWIGSVEYEVKGPGLSHNRILKRTNKDGSIKYGYSTSKDYKKIHEIKKKESK
nr:RHS repeat-associated core domain-containing protein [Chryseobacterium sp. MEBOG06]